MIAAVSIGLYSNMAECARPRSIRFIAKRVAPNACRAIGHSTHLNGQHDENTNFTTWRCQL